MSIHPTAVVDPGAELGPGVEIGPYSIVGPNVRLGENVVLRSHANVAGRTEIGAETQIFPFASVGEIPQDLKYHGEPTRLVIGARCVIREHATLNPGTGPGGGLTAVGDDNLIMIGAHVAHDCHIGNHVILSNNVALAGHIRVEDHAYLGGLAAVHQFVRIGESAMLAGTAGVSQDVAPFTIAAGNHANLVAVNRVNLERRGWDADRIAAVDRAFRILFRSGLRPVEAFARVREELSGSVEAEHMVAFLEKSERGFCRVR